MEALIGPGRVGFPKPRLIYVYFIVCVFSPPFITYCYSATCCNNKIYSLIRSAKNCYFIFLKKNVTYIFFKKNTQVADITQKKVLAKKIASHFLWKKNTNII